MKIISSPRFIVLLFALQGVTCVSFGQFLLSEQAWIPSYLRAKQIQHDSEFIADTHTDVSAIKGSSLLLNDKILDYNNFAIGSKGTLSVVRESPSGSKTDKIRFKVMIRREGKIITTVGSSEKGIFEIEISKVLARAKPGDQLIIDPIDPKDWHAKRILKLLAPC